MASVSLSVKTTIFTSFSTAVYKERNGIMNKKEKLSSEVCDIAARGLGAQLRHSYDSQEGNS